ncbi:MAG: hypothetical protein M3Y08_04500, partial [Fibrobacterota bacterium]|nr:hypothetical protein [Fibrobacterota bacterium]
MSLRPKALPIVALLAITAAAAFAIDQGSPDSVSRSKAPAADSAASPQDTTVQAALDTLEPKKLYEYISHPILQMLTLPIEYGLVPVVKFVIWPSKAPLRYFLNENVIDRTINLIGFGQDDKVMLYPTMSLAPGTGSSLGLTLRHNSLFGRPNERMVTMGNLYVNGDWKFRSYLNSNGILGTGLNSRLSMSLVRVKNTSVNQPGTSTFWYYADTSNTFSATLSHLIVEKLALKGTFVFRDNNYGLAPVNIDSLQADFFRNEAGLIDAQSRGLNKSWQD